MKKGNNIMLQKEPAFKMFVITSTRERNDQIVALAKQKGFRWADGVVVTTPQAICFVNGIMTPAYIADSFGEMPFTDAINLLNKFADKVIDFVDQTKFTKVICRINEKGMFKLGDSRSRHWNKASSAEDENTFFCSYIYKRPSHKTEFETTTRMYLTEHNVLEDYNLHAVAPATPEAVVFMVRKGNKKQ